VREWTFTLPSELPLWELESWWAPKFSKSNCRGQNPLDWKVPYIVEKFLEHKCLKWACMTHLDTWNISYGQKKGRKSNWQFDSQPLKVKNRPNFLACRWHVTNCWKAFNKGYNFTWNPISIEGLHINYGPPKLWKSQVWEFQDSHLGVPKQNDIWLLVLWSGIEYTIKGKVVASPKSRPWWVLCIWIFPWLVLAPKMF